MSFRLEKERTTSTPYLLIDEAKGYMRLEGRCFHENIGQFFQTITDWLDIYLATDFGTLTVDNAVTYFNSSTTKLLLNMLLKMDRHAIGGNTIIVNWHMSADNEIMQECGEDFAEEVKNLTFNMVVTEA